MKCARWAVAWITLVVVVMALGACGAAPEPVEDISPVATASPVPAVTAPVVSTAEPPAPVVPATEPAIIGPQPTTSDFEPAEGVLLYRRIELGEGGLTLEVPGLWTQLAPEWAWSPDGTSDLRVGVQWADLVPPMEAEAVLLPKNAQVLNAQELDVAWGQARQFDVEVYGQPVGQGERGQVASVQRHVLVVVDRDGGRRAYDVYAEAPSPEALEPLLPVLDQMVASAEPAAAPGPGTERTPTPALPAQSQAVQVFFGNPALDPSADECRAVYPVERQVAAAAQGLDAALNELFSGPTAAEQAAGYTSWFTLATANVLLDAFVDGDTAYVNLADLRPLIPSASSSCGSAQLLAEMGQTAQAAAPGVTRVIYAIEGQPQPFYEWLQLGCDEMNDFCDPNPFQGN